MGKWCVKDAWVLLKIYGFLFISGNSYLKLFELKKSLEKAVIFSKYKQIILFDGINFFTYFFINSSQKTVLENINFEFDQIFFLYLNKEFKKKMKFLRP